MSVMSLESISRLGHGMRHRGQPGRDRLRDLAREVRILRKQIRYLVRKNGRTAVLPLAGVGSAAYGLSRFARENGPMAMELFGRQAGRAGYSVRRHPLPTIAVLGLISLIAYMFLRRD